MKKRRLLPFLSYGFASSICLLTVSIASASPQNAVINGNFEQVTNNKPANWDVSETPGLIESRFPTEKDHGRIAQIEMTKWDAHGAYFSQSVDVTPHTRYRFSLNACMNTGNIRIALNGGDGDEKVALTQMGKAAHLSMYPFFWDEAWSKYLVFLPNEWRPVTMDFDSGNATKLLISFGGFQRQGIYSFDDVTLEEISK